VHFTTITGQSSGSGCGGQLDNFEVHVAQIDTPRCDGGVWLSPNTHLFYPLKAQFVSPTQTRRFQLYNRLISKDSDFDFEVFLLYVSRNAASNHANDEPMHGLGSVNTTIDFIVVPIPALARPSSSKGGSRLRRHQKKLTTTPPQEIKLCQHTTALRSKSGDTGECDAPLPRC
jgi:hypothetical protein